MFGQADAEITVYDQEKNCYKQNKAGTGPDFKAYDYIFEVHFNAKAHGDGMMDGSLPGSVLPAYRHPWGVGGTEDSEKRGFLGV